MFAAAAAAAPLLSSFSFVVTVVLFVIVLFLASGTSVLHLVPENLVTQAQQAHHSLLLQRG